MSDIWFTSDLHLGHANIIKYANRPFKNVEHMNSTLIGNWNSVVKPTDTIYILGDVFFCSADSAVSMMSSLNGHKILILGNHDNLIRKNPDVANSFDKILPDLFTFKENGQRTVMCHYPLLSWENSSKGSFMLHGHVHSKVPTDGIYRRYDVGVDANNYFPVSFSSIRRTLLKIPIKVF